MLQIRTCPIYELHNERLVMSILEGDPMIAALETSHKKGGIGTLKKLAAALKVELDNLA
jgi:hypothetical protein